MRRSIPCSSIPPFIYLAARVVWNVTLPAKTSNDGPSAAPPPRRFLGHRNMNLAMTTLFSGFGRPFYEAYAWHYPFPPSHRQQWEICNLYPLLIHLNLFGRDLRRGGPLPPLLGRPSERNTVAFLGRILRPELRCLREARLYLGNILHTIQRF